jgi:lysophospholipase
LGNYSDSSEDWLNLGGAQNYLPIEQLMVKARNVSVIIALDSTGENTENTWPEYVALFLLFLTRSTSV